MSFPELPIRTDRLDLRLFTADDFAALHAYQSRADVTRYLYFGPNDEAASREALARKRARTALREPGDVVNLAIVLRATGKLVGDVLLIWTSAEHRQGEIGYVLHPDHAGRGYATEAAREMLRLGFDGLDLHRIVGRLDARNTASPRCCNGSACATRRTCGRTSSSRGSGSTRRCTRCWPGNGGPAGPPAEPEPTRRTGVRRAGDARSDAAAGLHDALDDVPDRDHHQDHDRDPGDGVEVPALAQPGEPPDQVGVQQPVGKQQPGDRRRWPGPARR